MAEPHDRLEQALDRLAAGPAARTAEPPAAFLAAVGRRRTQRRVRVASVVLGVLVLVGAAATLLTRVPPGAPAAPRGPIAEAPLMTIGSVAERLAATTPVRSSHTPRDLPASSVYAADWRSEAKLAALIGSS